jgi:hypothetical protein
MIKTLFNYVQFYKKNYLKTSKKINFQLTPDFGLQG